MDRKVIGTIVGASLATASGIATAAAISRAWRGEDLWREGYLEGYATYPGELYDVFVEEGGEVLLVGRFPGIWFKAAADWYKFLYDSLRPFGLPPAGAIVAIGHARKAGVHSTGKRAPMRGFNNFGVKAGKSWRDDGKPFWVAEGQEWDEEAQAYSVPERMAWRFYESMEDAVDNWLKIMRQYPAAYAQLFSKNPDPEEYAYGLKHGVGGMEYTTGAFDMAELIAWALENVPPMLNKSFGYNLQV